MSMTGAPLLKLLSAQARTSATGIFSLRAVSGVTVKVVNVVTVGIFPPSFMTQTGTNSSTQTLGSGGLFAGSYTASCSSSDYGNGAPGPFAGVFQYPVNNYVWQVSRYPAGGGTVLTPTTAGYNGDWLQLQTPFPINLTGYSVKYGSLTSLVLLASTDASSWTLVDSNSGLYGGTITKTGLNFSGYSYFRFIIISGDTFPFLSDIKFNGTVTSLAQDFYADRLGNLLTVPVTGQSLSTWLGGSTGYVTTWYDQSGKGNHATQTTQGNRPSITLDASNRYQIDFTANGGSSWLNLLQTGTVPMQTAYTVICRYNTIGNTGGICGAGGTTLGTSNKFRRDGGTGYVNYWWNKDVFAAGYGVGNVVTFKFTAETSPQAGTTYIYSNGINQTVTPNSGYRSGWVGVSGNEVIGSTVPSVATENMNGQMYSLFLFASALSDADRIAVENAS
jgi:hypothetical protein